MSKTMMVVKIGVAEDKIGVDNADAAAALFFVLGEFDAIIVYIDKIYKPKSWFYFIIEFLRDNNHTNKTL
jgi:hypothetical protein